VAVQSALSSIAVFLLTVSAALASGQTASERTVSARAVSPVSPAIVICFVGGFVGHESNIHGGVQLADHLRAEYPSGLHVEVFENHRGEAAHQQVLRLLDANHDGALSPDEKRDARIIIYGHSWGGSETVNLARELQKDGIPVLLTIQIDSVRKPGENDALIPANVVAAANFYQPGGLVHGRPLIRAADPARTQIVGNFKFDYAQHPVSCTGYPWFARAFEKSHIEIECDPAVAGAVEALIRAKLPPPAPPGPESR
jgi:hypothetical protein